MRELFNVLYTLPGYELAALLFMFAGAVVFLVAAVISIFKG